MNRTLALLAMVALGPGEAGAQLLSTGFADPVCYVRSYSAEHLAGHPRQRVRAISLRRTADANPPREGGKVVDLELSVRARGARESWGGVAVCRDGAKRLACGMEGDMAAR